MYIFFRPPRGSFSKGAVSWISQICTKYVFTEPRSAIFPFFPSTLMLIARIAGHSIIYTAERYIHSWGEESVSFVRSGDYSI